MGYGQFLKTSLSWRITKNAITTILIILKFRIVFENCCLNSEFFFHLHHFSCHCSGQVILSPKKYVCTVVTGKWRLLRWWTRCLCFTSLKILEKEATVTAWLNATMKSFCAASQTHSTSGWASGSGWRCRSPWPTGCGTGWRSHLLTGWRCRWPALGGCIGMTFHVDVSHHWKRTRRT